MSGVHHDHSGWIQSSRVTRWLWWVIGVWGLATVIGIIALWPSGGHHTQDLSGGAERVEATVTGVVVQPCTGTDASQEISCRQITFDVTSGTIRGTSAVMEFGVSQSSAKVPDVGDDVYLDVVSRCRRDRAHSGGFDRSGRLGADIDCTRGSGAHPRGR